MTDDSRHQTIPVMLSRPRPPRRLETARRRCGSRTALLLLIVLGVAQSGCAVPTGSLRLTADDRLSFSAPEDGAEVELPVTLRWTMDDFEVQQPGDPVSSDAGSFAVIVDAYPMGPGEPLSELLPEGACSGAPDCPPPDLLQTLADTYVTRETTVTIPSVPATQYGGSSHYAVVVLVDADGRRIGDSSWTLNFTVRDVGSNS